jgi:dienelactone hydrolase
MNWKKIARYATGAVAALVLALALAKGLWDARCFRGYDASLPLEATEQLLQRTQLFTQYKVRFRSTPTETVPALLDVPAEGTGPFPCLVFLHGIGQEKEFLNEIAQPFMRSGFAMLAFDQVGRGERKAEDPEGLDALKQLRRRCAQTVIDARRAVDYLQTRQDLDTKRLALVGASLGGIVGVDAVAMEPRFRAAWIIYAGGNIPLILRENALFGTSGFYGRVVARVGGFLLKPIDPLYHVAQISPRPILLQNGKHDRLIPAECAQQLHDRAKEPKTVKWYDSDHIGDDAAVVRQVLTDGIVWLQSLK